MGPTLKQPADTPSSVKQFSLSTRPVTQKLMMMKMVTGRAKVHTNMEKEQSKPIKEGLDFPEIEENLSSSTATVEVLRAIPEKGNSTIGVVITEPNLPVTTIFASNQVGSPTTLDVGLSSSTALLAGSCDRVRREPELGAGPGLEGDTILKVSTLRIIASALSCDSTRSVRDPEKGAVASHISDGQEHAEKELFTNQVSLVTAEFTPLLDTIDRVVEKHGAWLKAKTEYGGHSLESDAGVSANLARVQDVANSCVAHEERVLSARLSPAQHEAQGEAQLVEQVQRQVQGLAGEGHEVQRSQVGQQAGEAWPRHSCLGTAAVLCTQLYTLYCVSCTELHESLQSLFTELSLLKDKICRETNSQWWYQEFERSHCRLQLGGVLRAVLRERGGEHRHPHYRYGEGANLGGVGHSAQNLQQVKIKLFINTKSRSPTLGMSDYPMSLFAEGSRVQHQLVQGRSLLLTYGTERMMNLAETAGNEALLLLPDELFSPGAGWQKMLEEDSNYAGLAFYPYLKIGEQSQVAVIPFMITEGRLEDLRLVIPSFLMSTELAEWLTEFRDEVTREGGQVTAASYSLSFHVLLRGVALPTMMSFLEEALTLRMDLLVMPVNNIQWSRH
jgi:hypothetical protein